MDMQVRPVQQRDVEAVRELDSTAFGDLFSKLTGTDVTLSLREREYFDFWRETDPAGALVALEDEHIVGLSMNHARGRSGWIGPLAVSTHCQGHGIGKALLHAGMSYLTSQGCRHIGLDTFANNPVSVSLYLKHDFEVCGAFVSVQRPLSGFEPPLDRGDGLSVSPLAPDDLPLVVQRQDQATGFDRTPDFTLCLTWHAASAFKLCRGDDLVGCVFCVSKRGRAVACSMYLDETVPLAAGVDRLLSACAGFARSAGSESLGVTATGRQTALLRHLFAHGFRTARTMVRMIHNPPPTAQSSALCTPLLSEKG